LSESFLVLLDCAASQRKVCANSFKCRELSFPSSLFN